ncbi:MAG: hypothetical protein Q3M24_20605 [Candidatus Electrothrix aestuarii]|uniref:SMODS and SLOG-associating 2TM effector domain-containing protein n=1 Tax=Candidatus Electrothrix aestuarii TaxID=3062594 RepID=A0AAU8LTR2_9BACT|nr:hypothetical protein [Candidatus Electrothrix aestuarii]
MKDNEINKEKIDILLKEYDIMRAEIRMYINKQYLALTAILAILTAGIFKSDPLTGGYIYVYIPFIVSGIIGFLSVVSFFVNRNAGYVRILEQRINSMYNTCFPYESDINNKKELALLFWENYYADVGMDRDDGNQLRSVFGIAISIIAITSIISILIVIRNGFIYLAQDNSFYAVLYASSSVMSVALTSYSYQYLNTEIRRKVREKNNNILNKTILIPNEE